VGYNQQFRDSIKKTAIGDERIYTTYATVKAVDGAFCSVITFDGEEIIEDVELQSVTSTNGILLTPVIDSIVLVSWLSKNKPFVTMYSELESVNLRGDEYGGLIKIQELTKQLEIVTDRLDTVYDALKNGVTIPNDGGAAYKASVSFKLNTQIEKENYNDIENENVKHG
jgi:hypothetical protein